MNWKIVCLVFIIVTSSCVYGAKQDNNIYLEVEKFVSNYYKEPKPEKASEFLNKFLKSKYFLNEEYSSYYLNERLSYFFGRIAQNQPDLIKTSLKILEEGNHKQRRFVIDILIFAGDEKIEKYFEDKLKAGRFINESDQIRYYLSKGIPYQYDPVTVDINEPVEIEYLLGEFMFSGNEDVIDRYVAILAEPNTVQLEPIDINYYVEYGKGRLIRYGKKDNNLLKIYKDLLTEATDNRLKILEDIVDSIDGSISIPKRIAEGKNEKPVTGAKAWALGASAMLIERNHGRHNYLSPSPINRISIKSERDSVDKWWGVESREDLLEDMDWLLNDGHHNDFEKQGKYLLGLDPNQYEQLLLKNIFNKEKWYEIKTVKDNYEKLGDKSILGWDLSRYICLARWGYLCAYISEDEAWEMIMPVARKLQETFDSWEDLGQNYLIGRRYWSYKRTQESGDSFEDAYQRLKDMKSSPWNLHPWDMDLGFSNPGDPNSNTKL